MTAAVRGETDPVPGMNRILLRNWQVNGGANVAAVHQKRRDDDEPEIERRLHPGIFFVDPTNAEGMERLLQLAASRDIPVFWLLPPLSPVLQALRDRSGAEEGYERFVISFLTLYPRLLTVLDARRGDYPCDAVHGPHSSERSGCSRAEPRRRRRRFDRCWTDHAPGRRPTGSRSRDPPIVRLGPPVIEDLEQSRLLLRVRDTAIFSSR